MITPLPNTWQQKPGSATLPFFGGRSSASRRGLPLTTHILRTLACYFRPRKRFMPCLQ
jgi:hypothetical protein